MTEYDFSPEAYERHMATQTRISNWIDTVTSSTQMPSPAVPQQFPDYHQQRSRPSYSQPHSQTHSRSNSVSRSHSREQPHHHRGDYRPRSHSHSSSRPHVTRSYTFAQPTHSRAYSYAFHHPPPPVPIPLPQPVPYLHPMPRRTRTLPPQTHVVYHTYDAPRGGPTYVIGAPVVGGVPPQMRIQNTVTPAKRSQPLLKRLFTSLGPWGSSSSGPSPKLKHPPTRRHRRRSSF